MHIFHIIFFIQLMAVTPDTDVQFNFVHLLPYNVTNIS